MRNCVLGTSVRAAGPPSVVVAVGACLWIGDVVAASSATRALSGRAVSHFCAGDAGGGGGEGGGGDAAAGAVALFQHV